MGRFEFLLEIKGMNTAYYLILLIAIERGC